MGQHISYANMYIDQFDFFTETTNELTDTFLPWIQVKRNTNDKLWVTDHFRSLVKWKHSAKVKKDTEKYKSLKSVLKFHLLKSL